MKFGALKFRFFKTDRGVTMVEFALVLPVLLLFILGITDVARYFAYQAILNKGAENGLNLALKVPNLDVDLNQYKPGDVDYQRFIQARDLVIARSIDVPLKTFFTDSNTDSLAKLVNFSYPDPDNSVTPAITITKIEDAGLIFPGETLATSTGSSVAHKTFPNPPNAQTKEDLLKSHPIMVELKAEVKPVTPFLNPITLTARAMGFREEVPRGPLTGEYGYAADPVPGGGGTPPPTPTATPTPIPLEDADILCNPDWESCSKLVVNLCPDVNTPSSDSSGDCQCKPCNSVDDPGAEKLGF